MKYVISKADLQSTRHEIHSLWEQNLPFLTDFRYVWHYEKNPFGPAICLVVRDEKMDAVGSAALFPRRILLNGKSYSAAIAGDFSINKSHRVLGPALALQKALIASARETGITILYGVPNALSTPVFKTVGYRLLGKLDRMTKPLRSRYYLGRYIKSDLLLSVCSRTVDWGMKAVSAERYIRKSPDRTYAVQDEFDARFDAFWERAAREYPVIAERSSAALRWRFLQSTQERHHIFTLTKNDNHELLGYIVYTQDNSTVRIMDLLARDTEKTFDQLIGGFIRFQRTAGAHSITICYLGNGKLVRKLLRYGFSARPDKDVVMVYLAPGAADASTLMDAQKWHFLSGDSDI